MCPLGAQPYIHEPPFHSHPSCVMRGICASIENGIYCGQSSHSLREESGGKHVSEQVDMT